MPDPILSLRNITKTYPGVVALNHFSIDFEKGEIHALLGENGAGKSTLIKIISGAIQPDSGIILFNNHEYRHMTPALSRDLGVAVIYQEFSLVEPLSVAQNVFLGAGEGLLADDKAIKVKTSKIFAEMQVDIGPSVPVRALSPAKKQLVEIAKAISRNARILIMDEPSAPLSASEVETMFRIIAKLKEDGVTVIYISHRLEELFRVSDRVTVMRDGCYVATLNTSQTDRRTLISMEVGRELNEYYPRRTGNLGEVVLEVKNLSGMGDRGISFSLRRGEILGVAGLVGSGRTEMATLIYGLAKKDSGEVWVNGKEVEISAPDQAIHHGIGLIPEDRKQLGCLTRSDIRFNISLSIFNRLVRWMVIDSKKIDEIARYYAGKLSIRTPSLQQRIENLSGGNQQKVVIAKTLAADTNILIFDEPTRGIDVGAKQEIYHLMVDLANQGKAIIMISSEMEELLGMSDRLIVLSEGKFMGEIPKEQFDQQLVLELASGHRELA